MRVYVERTYVPCYGLRNMAGKNKSGSTFNKAEVYAQNDSGMNGVCYLDRKHKRA